MLKNLSSHVIDNDKLLLRSFLKMANCWLKSKISWNPELSHNMEKEDKKHLPPDVTLQILAGKGGFGVTFYC